MLITFKNTHLAIPRCRSHHMTGYHALATSAHKIKHHTWQLSGGHSGSCTGASGRRVDFPMKRLCTHRWRGHAQGWAHTELTSFVTLGRHTDPARRSFRYPFFVATPGGSHFLGPVLHQACCQCGHRCADRTFWISPVMIICRRNSPHCARQN